MMMAMTMAMMMAVMIMMMMPMMMMVVMTPDTIHLSMARVGTRKEKVPPWMIGKRQPRLL